MNAPVSSSAAALFSANRSRIIGYLRAMHATEDAEDLAQELWLRLDRMADVEHVSVGYLMRMAHNLMLDQARSFRQRRRREEAYQTDGPGGGEVDQTPDAERVLLSRERLARLHDVLRGLGPRTETIVRRHRIDGVSQRMLAQELGISLSAVEKQLQKAYRAIASIQREQDEEPGEHGDDVR